MKHPDGFQPAFVLYANTGSSHHPTSMADGQKSGQSFQAAPVMDPHKVAAEEPVRWAAYFNAAHPNDKQAQMTFGICEKTVRLWRAGDRAPRTSSRTIAERLDRKTVDRFMHGGRVEAGRYFPE